MMHGCATSWSDVASVVEMVASRPRTIDLVGPEGYIHGWIKVADEIAGHARQVTANGKGDRHKLVGYRMARAAEELRAGNRKAALAHLHAARLDSMGQGRRSGRAGMGSVHASGLGPVHSLINGHIRTVGNLPS